MIGWFRTHRRLQAEIAYLKARLAEAENRPALVVKPGPPPTAAPAEQAAAPYDVEEILRGQIRALTAMKTVKGAAELAKQVRTWRELATVLDERLERARLDSEASEQELLRWTDRARAAEGQLDRLQRSAELLGPS